MSVSAKNVQELRKITGAGMMDCKKALTESANDLAQAVEILRKKGMSAARNKASRSADEGRVSLCVSESSAAAVIVSCETDFVAKGELFATFADSVSEAVFKGEIIPTQPIPASWEQQREALIARIGENIQFGESVRFEPQPQCQCVGYSHGFKIGVIVQYRGGSPELARDMAMQIAAMRPQYIADRDVPETVKKQERDIAREQANKQADLSAKPAAIVDKIIQGKLQKSLDEMCLLGQAFIKDSGTKVAQVLQQQGLEVVRFARLEIGSATIDAETQS